jgi:hypothetical protein
MKKQIVLPEGISSLNLHKPTQQFTLSKSGARIWTAASLLGYSVSVLVDSGNTSMTALPASLFNIINANKNNKFHLSPYNHPVLAAGGQRLKILGYLPQPLPLIIQGLP